MAHIQTKAFLFTLNALCADKPLSSGGFFLIKLVARFRVGVGASGFCCCSICLSVSEVNMQDIAVVVGVTPTLLMKDKIKKTLRHC